MVLHCYIDGVGAFLKSLNLQSNVFSMWPIFLELFNHSMIRVLCLNLKFRKEIPMYKVRQPVRAPSEYLYLSQNKTDSPVQIPPEEIRQKGRHCSRGREAGGRADK